MQQAYIETSMDTLPTVRFSRFNPSFKCKGWFSFRHRMTKALSASLTLALLSGCAHQVPKQVQVEKPQNATQLSTTAPEKAGKATPAKQENTVPQPVQNAANMILKRIEGNLYVPQSAVGVLSTEVRLNLDKDTHLTDVKVVKSSGSTEFDNRVKIAVFKSFPISDIAPLNDNEYRYLKEIDLTVKPEK